MRDNNLHIVFALLVSGLLAAFTFAYTTGMPIIKDAAQNTRGAYNLVHAGVISTIKSDTETPRPQMRREPLPIVVMAGFLLLHPAFQQPYGITDLTNGRLTEAVATRSPPLRRRATKTTRPAR